MGGTVRFPHDEPPMLLQTAASSIEEAVNLEPMDITKGRIPMILETTRMLREKLQNETFVKTGIDSAPFSAAAAALGPQELLINLIDEPELCHSFLKICTESVIRFGLAAAEAGAHGIEFGDSPSMMLSRNMYMEFVLPYAREAITVIKEKTGLPVFYHVCGNTKHILDLMVETGADCIEIDSMVPMSLAKEVAAGRCAVKGNISTIETFYQGTPEDVTKEANRIIDLFGNNGGLVLSSGCEIPRHTPRENIRAMTEAVRNYPYSKL